MRDMTGWLTVIYWILLALLYCPASIWQPWLTFITPSHRLYVKHLCDRGAKMFGMFMSLHNVYTVQEDVNRYSKWDQNASRSYFCNSFWKFRNFWKIQFSRTVLASITQLYLLMHFIVRQFVSLSVWLEWAKGLYKNYWVAEVGWLNDWLMDLNATILLLLLLLLYPLFVKNLY